MRDNRIVPSRAVLGAASEAPGPTGSVHKPNRPRPARADGVGNEVIGRATGLLQAHSEGSLHQARPLDAVPPATTSPVITASRSFRASLAAISVRRHSGQPAGQARRIQPGAGGGKLHDRRPPPRRKCAGKPRESPPSPRPGGGLGVQAPGQGAPAGSGPGTPRRSRAGLRRA